MEPILLTIHWKGDAEDVADLTNYDLSNGSLDRTILVDLIHDALERLKSKE